ncbi:MAG TPA: WecB/TagA/CpsF family glycosyltransferase [Candidatus Obscuribacterales bacterium]
MSMNTVSKSWPTTRLLGIPVDCPGREQLLNHLIAHAKSPDRDSWHLVTMNAEMADAATRDRAFFDILQQADVIIPDGIGVVWALGHEGIKVQRLPGVELVEELFRRADGAGLRLGILGSSPETLGAFQDQIPAKFGKVELVFCQNGYFKADEEQEILARMRAARPDILFVALGVPKQEAWIAKHRAELGIPIMMGVGGSFDVISGRLQRAPAWMRRAHLEWLYRLYQQPTRWRRMLALPRFVLKVLRP